MTRLPKSKNGRNASFGPRHWLADHGVTGPEFTGSLRVWDLTGPVPVVLIEETKPVYAWDFRPDGRLVAVSHPDGSLTTYELPSGKRLKRLARHDITIYPWIRLHPTAPYVVVTSTESSTVEIRHLETGETIKIDPYLPQRGTYPGEWSLDGRILAIPGAGVGKITLYDFVADPPAVRLRRSIDGIDAGQFLAFNAAGDRLFGRGWSKYLIMYDLTTGQVLFKTQAIRASSVRGLHTDRQHRHLSPGMVYDPVRRLGYWSVAEGRECRLMVPSSPRGACSWITVSPDGRIAVGTSGRWLTAYDLETGRDLGSIEFPQAAIRINPYFDPTGRLLTNTHIGCFRWPIRSDPTVAGSVLIGPPERLRLNPGENDLATSRDGIVVAQAMENVGIMAPYAGGWILNRKGSAPAIRVLPNESVGTTTVSPDGRWVAFGSSEFSSTHILVYDVLTGKQEWQSPRGEGSCRFTPGGDWLATQADNGRMYATGSWEPGPQLGYGAIQCFSSDGTLAVLATAEGQIRLVEVATGREIARLEDPELSTGRVAMTPDGTKLITPNKDGVRVWDLRLIRTELTKLGLDWDAPPFPQETKSEAAVKVSFVGAELLDPDSTMNKTQRLFAPWLKGSKADAGDYLARADELIRLGWHDLALRDYDATIRRFPKLTEARMHRGLERFRRAQWRAAAEDFNAVLEGDPNDPSRGPARSRLAWAYSELGRHADAAAELVKLLETSPTSWQAEDRAGLLLLRAEFYDRAGTSDQARTDRDLAAKAFPKLSEAANSRAWQWLMPKPDQRPQENWRFVPAALLLARKAVELAPNDPLIQNTLGVALYRSGQYAEAKGVLETGLARGKWPAGRLGPLPAGHVPPPPRPPESRSGPLRSGRRMGEEPRCLPDGRSRELAELQAEARRLLGLRD